MRTTDYTDVPFAVRLFARVLPSADREWVVGDLLEDAHGRGLEGARRALWLASECTVIAAGFSIGRVRGWFVLPSVREVAAGLAVDGRGLLRSDPSAIVVRGMLFCASVATLAFAVDVLVRSLMRAAGL
jgi:hypothetical protein